MWLWHEFDPPNIIMHFSWCVVPDWVICAGIFFSRPPEHHIDVIWKKQFGDTPLVVLYSRIGLFCLLLLPRAHHPRGHGGRGEPSLPSLLSWLLWAGGGATQNEGQCRRQGSKRYGVLCIVAATLWIVRISVSCQALHVICIVLCSRWSAFQCSGKQQIAVCGIAAYSVNELHSQLLQSFSVPPKRNRPYSSACGWVSILVIAACFRDYRFM